MSDAVEAIKRDMPEAVLEAVQHVRAPGMMTLEVLFAGDEHELLRQEILRTGVARYQNRELRIQTRPLPGGEHEVLALGAISRNPGSTQNYLNSITDFTSAIPSGPVAVRQYRAIYKTEGIINNAVNKIAALIGIGGRFKVRRAKRGKVRNATERLQLILDHLVRNVNNSSLDSVVTSDRGIRSVIRIGARHALVEGDWIAREQWTNADVPDVGKVSLPLHIQTISMQYLEPVPELAGLGELWYWRPPDALLRQLESKSKVKEIQQVVDRLVDKDMLKQLKSDRKALLDPALMLHVRHRGFADELFGESLVEPAKLGIRYSRALTAADLVSMENIVNRLTIVQVGSADPKSPYSKSDVAAARAALMQSFFEDIGPNMIIVWQGDDVKIEDVGVQDTVLDINERYRIAENKIKSALGLPDALLTGTSGDGRSAGWASIVGAAAQIQELANAFTTVLSTLAERVAEENGYGEVDVVWEFDGSLLADNGAARTNNRSDYTTGLLSIRTMLAAAGFDPEAEYTQQCLERDLPVGTPWKDVFLPPQGLQGQGAGGIQGQGDGKDPGAGRPDSGDEE